MGEAQWKGSYDQVGSPSDVSFSDPTGQYAAAVDRMSNEYNRMLSGMSGQLATGQNYMNQAANYDPNAYMNQFLGQSAGLANLAQGATSPLTQSLNAVAARQAALGGEAALAAMPGAANSGAGMAAFADAYASPFADVASQVSQAQLGLTGNLWNQAMGNNASAQQFGSSVYQNLAGLAGQNAGLYGSLAGSGLGNYAQLAGGMGDIYVPQYEYTQGIEDRLWGLGGQVLGGVAGGVGAGLGAAMI